MASMLIFGWIDLESGTRVAKFLKFFSLGTNEDLCGFELGIMLLGG
jgi:hypothetical protein